MEEKNNEIPFQQGTNAETSSADPFTEMPPWSQDQAFSQQAPLVYAPVRKPRRVGTFTLGIALIGLGLFIPYALSVGASGWKLLCFAPLLLVLLGIETLIYAFSLRGEKLRYDGLSVFLVFLITFATLAGSVAMPPLHRFAEFKQQETTLCREADEQARRILSQNRCVGSAYSYAFSEDDWYFLLDQQPEMEMGLDIRVDLRKIPIQSPSASQVADLFWKLCREMKEIPGLHRLNLEYASDRPAKEGGSDSVYYLQLYADEIDGLDVSMLEERIHVEEFFWIEDEKVLIEEGTY